MAAVKIHHQTLLFQNSFVLKTVSHNTSKEKERSKQYKLHFSSIWITKIESDTHLHPSSNADSNPSGIRFLKSTDTMQTSRLHDSGGWEVGSPRSGVKWNGVHKDSCIMKLMCSSLCVTRNNGTQGSSCPNPQNLWTSAYMAKRTLQMWLS